MKRSLSLVAFLTLTLLVTGCASTPVATITPVSTSTPATAPAPVVTPVPTEKVVTQEKSKSVPTPVATKTPTPTPVPATAPAAAAPAVKKFSITAQSWSFSPSTITVNKGDQVELSIKSVDVDHGFFLSAFNVNKKLKPGETATASFTADKVGSFSFTCSVFCGSGHASMSGTLIVK